MTRERSVTLVGDKELFDFEMKEVIERLHKTIIDLYNCGFRHFVCGMDTGFSLLAGEFIMVLKQSFPELTLTAAVPFEGQERRYKAQDKVRYRNLLKQADQVFTLSEKWFTGCLVRRNDFMIDQSSCVLAYYDGTEEGCAHYTCNRAKALGMRICNIY